MTLIKVLNKEHENITKLLKISRVMATKLLNNEEVDFDDFYKVIDFIKNYADNFHHKKEEDFLFNEMVAHLGEVGDKIINHGMNVEHEMARAYLFDLTNYLEELRNGNEDKKLDVIATLISYTHLLTKHIDKEDRVIYTFAERELNKEIMDKVNAFGLSYENENKEIKEKYLKVLNDLEKKYL